MFKASIISFTWYKVQKERFFDYYLSFARVCSLLLLVEMNESIYYGVFI